MRKLLVIFIVLLAFVLRFWRLGEFPPINADEAAIAYNAYSLLQTGMDEHGKAWPIHFQSFNDYKPGLYFYIVMPFVAVMGLGSWAVRVPSALMGVGSVYLLYLLVREIGGKRKYLAEIAGLFLAVSPWHLHFSRGGWEVNVATFFIVLGVYLFLKSLKDSRYYVLCTLTFALSLYTYHAARIVVPLLGLGLVFFYRKDFVGNVRSLVIAGLVGFVVLIPLGVEMLGPAGVSRASGVGLFADTGPLTRVNEQRGEHEDYLGITAKILHNKPTNYGLAFMENWSEHYWGEFLFLSGDEIQRNKVPEMGQMYIYEIVFVLVGLYFIVKKQENWKIVVWWLLVAPVAAALTFQSPHALRAQNMVIPLTIISAYGFWRVWETSLRRGFGWQVRGLLILLLVWGVSRYLHMYWVHMPKEYPSSSQYGVDELVSYVEERGDYHPKVIVTDRYDQPYILFLYYMKYPPQDFIGAHSLTEPDGFGFSTVRVFDKYEFRSINFDVDRPSNPNAMIIGTDEEIPDEANVTKRIYFPNGEVAFEVVE